MPICVHRVDHDSKHRDLLALLESNLPELCHERRLPWLRANPDGPPWSWFVHDTAAGQIVGTASIFPHSLWVRGEVKLCGQVGDFAISPAYRSLGPAIMLHRSMSELVDQGTLSFYYDCTPHERGMATFRRLGRKPQCAVQQYALPLRVDGRLAKIRGLSVLAPAANALLRIRRKSKYSSPGLEISEHPGLFGEEFSDLDRALTDSETIRIRRSSAFLNWRYRQDPLQEYQVLTARRFGQLRAFVVFCAAGEEVTIVDLFGMDQPGAGRALLEAVVERCEVSCETIYAFLAAGSQMAGVHAHAGFRRRPVATQIVAYAKPGSSTSDFLQETWRWTFSGVDIRA